MLPLSSLILAGAVPLYLVSGVALKIEISGWLPSRKLVALKGDNIQLIFENGIFSLEPDIQL